MQRVTLTIYKYILIALLVPMLLLIGEEALARRHKTHVVQKGDTPAMLAKKYQVAFEEIMRFNQMRPGDVLRVGSSIAIPFPGEVTGATYKVKQGDSVARIADFHGISQDDLRSANGLKPGDSLRVGQTLSIPHELRGGTGRGYVVRAGDTLASIATKHGVTVKALAAANKLARDGSLDLGRTLVIPENESDVSAVYHPQKVNKLLTTGEKVSGGVRHTVQPGQSLWIIARAYNTTGQKIAKANGFSTSKALKVGDKILIPGARAPVPVRVKGYTIQPIHFISVWDNESATLRLLSKSGQINEKSRRALSALAGSRYKSNRIKIFHPRLIHMIQRVAERYPGQTIELISGYRPQLKGHRQSKHNVGHALEFRVQGVDRRELYNFITELPKAGAGYYPNSVFVHMDVRDKPTVWTDYSGPGQPARMRPPDVDPEALSDAE